MNGSSRALFLSYCRPTSPYQQDFMGLVHAHLTAQEDFETIVLGGEPGDPLSQIVRAIDGSTGLLALAFRRNLIGEGSQRIVEPDGSVTNRQIANEWLTSSYCHIEVALAFRAGIPLLILQEHDVVPEGVLDRSSTGRDIELIAKESLPTTAHELANSPVGDRISGWLNEVRRRSGGLMSATS